jgi:hypothetical protein
VESGVIDNYIFQLSDVYREFYNRLDIRIIRNGLTWTTDIRDKQAWIKEFMRAGETTTLIEREAEEKYGVIVGMMKGFGWQEGDISRVFRDLTGKDLV